MSNIILTLGFISDQYQNNITMTYELANVDLTLECQYDTNIVIQIKYYINYFPTVRQHWYSNIKCNIDPQLPRWAIPAFDFWSSSNIGPDQKCCPGIELNFTVSSGT